MNSPSKLLLMLEAARSVYEYGQHAVLSGAMQYISPKGDGHPVIVLPGLGATDSSTQPLRSFLKNIGYDAHAWNLGRNLGPKDGLDTLLDIIAARLLSISTAHGGIPVSVIGWSLGGIYAREVAKRVPDLVRQVITLGTPFKGAATSTNAAMLYELLNKDRSHHDPVIVERVTVPPPQPYTSIYSKSDGVVAWQSSIEIESNIIENIEVPGASHLGLGHNPIVMHIIADRLSQSTDNWHRYKSTVV